MDIDRFIAANTATWQRLGALTDHARRGAGRLSTDDVDELVQLYQRTSAHLSHARTYYKDSALTAQLTRTVAAANAVIYGRRTRTVGAVTRFFAWTFPAAVREHRRFISLAAALFLVPAAIMLIWLINSPEALSVTASEAERELYCAEQFESYYSEQPSAQFATLVGVNNVYVSFLAFTGGALLMLPGLFVIMYNGLILGQAAAWMTTCGEATTFWTLIAPHGLLELTSIILAGAAGLRVGWTILVPGDRTRADAIAEEGRRAGAMILGLVACFVVAALIEGFVTGSALPIEVRVAIGVLVWLAFVLYVIVQGREAAARGLDGMLGELDRGWSDVAVPEATAYELVRQAAAPTTGSPDP